MPQNTAATSGAASGARLLAGALAIALTAAGFWIVQLQARVQQLEERLAAVSTATAAPAQAAAPAAPARAVPAAPVFTAEQQQAMVQKLAGATDPERKAWFHVQQANAESAAVAAALMQVFEQAGWATETVRVPYPLKSGLFLLAGDAQPPAFVDAVNEALSSAGFEVQYLTGYREFVAERKQTNPGWVGPELAEGQAFSLVIGGRPATRP